eukprot:1140620-Pelagomonas_calceolata.AAC.11
MSGGEGDGMHDACGVRAAKSSQVGRQRTTIEWTISGHISKRAGSGQRLSGPSVDTSAKEQAADNHPVDHQWTHMHMGRQCTISKLVQTHMVRLQVLQTSAFLFYRMKLGIKNGQHPTCSVMRLPIHFLCNARGRREYLSINAACTRHMLPALCMPGMGSPS